MLVVVTRNVGPLVPVPLRRLDGTKRRLSSWCCQNPNFCTCCQRSSCRSDSKVVGVVVVVVVAALCDNRDENENENKTTNDATSITITISTPFNCIRKLPILLFSLNLLYLCYLVLSVFRDEGILLSKQSKHSKLVDSFGWMIDRLEG